ncbi:MAG: glycosyl transferase, partial [Pseudolabrys sp.]
PVGMRLKSAAATARTPWLLFLRAGTVPQAGWIEATGRFMQVTDMRDGAACAGVFRLVAATDYMRPRFGELLALLRATLGGSPHPDQGLLSARRFYEAVGGHDASADAEATLLRRLGRRRMAMLPAAIGVVR